MSLVSAENSNVAVAENDYWLVDEGIDRRRHHRPNQSCAIETGRISIVSTSRLWPKSTMNFVDASPVAAAAAVVGSSSV